MVQARGAVAPTSLIILLLLVVLGPRDVQAAPWQARGSDVSVGDGSPASWLGSLADAQANHAGLQRPKYKAKHGKSLQRAAEVLEELRGKLKKVGHEIDREGVEKEVLWQQGSRSVQGSGGEPVPIQSRGSSGVVSETTPNVHEYHRSTGVYRPRDGQTYLKMGIAGALGSVPVVILACGVLIWIWRKRAKFPSATSGAQLENAQPPPPATVQIEMPPAAPSLDQSRMVEVNTCHFRFYYN